MTSVVAVAGVAGQRRALDRLPALVARDRRGVQQLPLVAPRRAGDRQGAQDAGHQRRRAAQPAIVGRLPADVREQPSEPVGHRPQPAAFGAIAEQGLGHGQADQLSVGQPGPAARPVAGLHHLIDGDIQCDNEIVEDGAREAFSLEVDVVGATPILGSLVTSVTTYSDNPKRRQSSSAGRILHRLCASNGRHRYWKSLGDTGKPCMNVGTASRMALRPMDRTDRRTNPVLAFNEHSWRWGKDTLMTTRPMHNSETRIGNWLTVVGLPALVIILLSLVLGSILLLPSYLDRRDLGQRYGDFQAPKADQGEE
jgi:hypothetical protein